MAAGIGRRAGAVLIGVAATLTTLTGLAFPASAYQDLEQCQSERLGTTGTDLTACAGPTLLPPCDDKACLGQEVWLGACVREGQTYVDGGVDIVAGYDFYPAPGPMFPLYLRGDDHCY